MSQVSSVGKLLAVFLSSISPALTGGQSVALDRFRIEAMAGASSSGVAWSLTLDESGVMTVEIDDLERGKTAKRTTVSTGAQVQAIRNALTKSRFLQLPEIVGPEHAPLDCRTYSLRVTLAGITRQVILLEPDRATGDDVVRFRRVWEAVRAAAPFQLPH